MAPRQYRSVSLFCECRSPHKMKVLAAVRVVAELLLLCVKSLHKTKQKKNNKPVWVRDWIKKRRQLGCSSTLLKEIVVEDPRSYFNHLRMSAEQFVFLLNRVSNAIKKQDTVMREALSPELKLQITLRFLASGDSYSSLQYLYCVPKSTIAKFVPTVCDAIHKGLANYMEIPQTEDEWREIIKNFEIQWSFPWFGAVDCKHVVIKCPPKSVSEFYNYKGTFSIVLFAVADSNYCFTYVHIGEAGRASDGGIFASSTLKHGIIENRTRGLPEDAFLVGDDAFPLTPYLMKPFSRPGALSITEKIFKYRLSRARRVVENAFGILVSKFCVYEKPIPLRPQIVDKVVRATCASHNWQRKTAPKQYVQPQLVYQENVDSGVYQPGSWRNANAAGLVDARLHAGSNNYSKQAALRREWLANYFLADGSVPWQYQHV